MWPLDKMEWLLATLTSMEECGQTKVTKGKEPKRCPNYETRSIKEHSITSRLPHKWSWPIQTILIVIESYTNAANNWPGAVITQDNCRLGCWGLGIGTHYCASWSSAILLLVLVQHAGKVNPFLEKCRPIALLSWKSPITQCNYSVTNLNY